MNEGRFTGLSFYFTNSEFDRTSLPQFPKTPRSKGPSKLRSRPENYQSEVTRNPSSINSDLDKPEDISYPTRKQGVAKKQDEISESNLTEGSSSPSQFHEISRPRQLRKSKSRSKNPEHTFCSSHLSPVDRGPRRQRRLLKSKSQKNTSSPKDTIDTFKNLDKSSLLTQGKVVIKKQEDVVINNLEDTFVPTQDKVIILWDLDNKLSTDPYNVTMLLKRFSELFVR
ncbi:hypothetical protein DSL72_007361 [Monilinia vaccinii-corymbosi]|uniref:Uncharacterized protein n=1 Tax=Monilinia vaccinii-corymbosi TaxID=61207 RepID=A0A8A3PMR1_9HELO|nr:hypothetical protein DSL72_007361 [Monilinia vaccinii-corymbosi]